MTTTSKAFSVEPGALYIVVPFLIDSFLSCCMISDETVVLGIVPAKTKFRFSYIFTRSLSRPRTMLQLSAVRS